MLVYLFDLNGDYAGSTDCQEVPENGTTVAPAPLPLPGYTSPRWTGSEWVYPFGFSQCVEDQ